jgi:transposase-like protein
MPKKIDPAARERVVRLVLEHRGEYPSVTVVIAAVARQEGIGHESLRRWVAQAEIDAGTREGTTSEELAEIKRLKAENRRLREDNEILKQASISFAGGTQPPQPMICGFIDQLRAGGHAVEPIGGVLREQGVQVAARTYRSWRAGQIAPRTVTDAMVEDAIRDEAWDVTGPGQDPASQADPGRALRAAEDGRVDPPHEDRRHVSWRCGPGDARTRAGGGAPGQEYPHRDPRQGRPPGGDLLNRDFTAPCPDRTWAADFTYVR